MELLCRSLKEDLHLTQAHSGVQIGSLKCGGKAIKSAHATRLRTMDLYLAHHRGPLVYGMVLPPLLELVNAI